MSFELCGLSRVRNGHSFAQPRVTTHHRGIGHPQGQNIIEAVHRNYRLVTTNQRLCQIRPTIHIERGQHIGHVLCGIVFTLAVKQHLGVERYQLAIEGGDVAKVHIAVKRGPKTFTGMERRSLGGNSIGGDITQVEHQLFQFTLGHTVRITIQPVHKVIGEGLRVGASFGRLRALTIMKAGHMGAEFIKVMLGERPFEQTVVHQFVVVEAVHLDHIVDDLEVTHIRKVDHSKATFRRFDNREDVFVKVAGQRLVGFHFELRIFEAGFGGGVVTIPRDCLEQLEGITALQEDQALVGFDHFNGTFVVAESRCHQKRDNALLGFRDIHRISPIRKKRKEENLRKNLYEIKWG